MDPVMSPARSWLFVPATRHDRFAKAASSGADRVIIDLEDAVAPAEKAEACQRLADAVLPTSVPVYLRINGAGTEWFKEDLAMAARLAITGVFLPKADTAEHVQRVAARLPQAQRVVAIIETARGAWNVMSVARARHIERLVFGAVDFELDTGMRDAGDACAWVRSQIVIASKVAGIGAPIDSVSLSFDDDAQLASDAARSWRYGFAGKLCIHPRQIAITNAAFQPSADEVTWARALLEEHAAHPADAVFTYRGTMVDRPVIARARVIQSLADTAALPEAPRESGPTRSI
jgi:citrate lyase subunit beta / citryl-CoA lyase